MFAVAVGEPFAAYCTMREWRTYRVEKAGTGVVLVGAVAGIAEAAEAAVAGTALRAVAVAGVASAAATDWKVLARKAEVAGTAFAVASAVVVAPVAE